MLRFLIHVLQPPSRDEWKTSWQGIAVGGAFALLLLAGTLAEEESRSFVWYAIDGLFLYLITFLGVIANRIARSERKK